MPIQNPCPASSSRFLLDFKREFSYETQKHRKGDFVDQIEKDKAELNIKLEDKEIKEMTKSKWKDMIKQKTEEKAFKDLLKENSEKNKKQKTLFLKASSLVII